jgi:hypothetical protein
MTWGTLAPSRMGHVGPSGAGWPVFGELYNIRITNVFFHSFG